jgi:3-phenylpropionate/trans-cinnamate dioxygenase ferredoxin reductase subunit
MTTGMVGRDLVGRDLAEPIICLGAGQAAQQAVATLRDEGYGGDILLFGEEPFLPYQRPPLSKAFLGGEMSADRLELRPRAFYDERGVTLHLGRQIRSLDPVAHRIDDDEGRSYRYSKLLLATGTRARRIALPGHDLAGIHHLRGIADVEALRAALQPGLRLAIIGGGYIGLEVAAKARSLGVDVTVIEAAPRILARVVAEPTAHFLADLHQQHGVVLRAGTGVAALVGTGRVEAVALADGSRVPADLVLVAVGAVPNVELAAAAGLTVENGIAVDGAARSSVPDVFAAGDVTSFESRRYGRRIRLECVQNAIDQAKVAASAMLGATPDYDPVPWFWSDQFATKLQIVGLNQGFDRTEIEGDPASGRFALRYLAGDRLLAVDSLNDPKSHMLGRRALAAA